VKPLKLPVGRKIEKISKNFSKSFSENRKSDISEKFFAKKFLQGAFSKSSFDFLTIFYTRTP